MHSDARDAQRWLKDILHNISLAEEFAGTADYNVFKDDRLRIYAVTRCLEIISEASRRLPEDLKGRHPSIEWREMAAAGNVYRHEYEDVAARVVLRTVTHDLPRLRTVIEQELMLIGE